MMRSSVKGVSVFRIALKPGVFLAELSGTQVLDGMPTAFEVTVSVGAARPPVWNVELKRVD